MPDWSELECEVRAGAAARGLSLRELAEEVAISRGSIYEYIRGDRVPPVDVALRIADTLALEGVRRERVLRLLARTA